MKVLVPYLLLGGRLTVDEFRVGQFVTFLLTHGIVVRRTRGDYRRAAPIEGLAWTVGEELLLRALRALTAATVR